MAEVSVIIPTLKDRRDVECLECLERGAFTAYEVILRDDEGAAKARNEGIRHASADKLVFLDDDSRPRGDYLSTAATALESEAVVAGRTVHPRDDLFRRQFTDHYDHGSNPSYVDSFVSCNLAMRREVLESVGTFDENFEWGHEETELAERIRSVYDIYYEPELVVEHAYAESMVDFWIKRYRQETQRSYYWRKSGITVAGQLARTGYTAVRPGRYVGGSVPHTVAKTGATVACTLGRLRGILAGRPRAAERRSRGSGADPESVVEGGPTTMTTSKDSASAESTPRTR